MGGSDQRLGEAAAGRRRGAFQHRHGADAADPDIDDLDGGAGIDAPVFTAASRDAGKAQRSS